MLRRIGSSSGVEQTRDGPAFPRSKPIRPLDSTTRGLGRSMHAVREVAVRVESYADGAPVGQSAFCDPAPPRAPSRPNVEKLTAGRASRPFFRAPTLRQSIDQHRVPRL